MKRTFFSNTVVLAASFQILRVFGIFIIAYLASRIGTEGIGLYQLIFTLYVLVATLVTSGIGTAVTRLVAESMGKSGQKSASNVLRYCILYSLAISIAVGIALYFAAGFIGTTFLNDSRTILSIQIMAPSLPFMAVISCLRNYFYGVRKAIQPASIMLFEQIIQFLILLAIIGSFAGKGLEYACFAVILTSVAAEGITFIYSLILYLIDKRRSKLVIVRDKDIQHKILGIAVPVAGSSYLRSGLRTVESMLIPSRLRMSGISTKVALSQYGLLIGMVMPILFFPTAILFAISTLLLPEISEANALNDAHKVNLTVSKVLQITLLFSLLFFGIFVFFPGELCMAVYQSREAGTLLRILAPLVPLIYMDILVDSMMNGLNKQTTTLVINIIDYSLRIVLILIFVPQYGLPAYVVIFFISTVLNAFLSLNRLVKASSIKLDLANWVFKPLLSIAASGLAATLISDLIPMGGGWGLTFKITLIVLLYVGLLFWLECITKKDMLLLKQLARGSKKYEAQGKTLSE